MDEQMRAMLEKLDGECRAETRNLRIALRRIRTLEEDLQKMEQAGVSLIGQMQVQKEIERAKIIAGKEMERLAHEREAEGMA